MIVPPWINKFYVLDLNPEKSFIRWAVSQGLTVFVISWVNPDARHAEKGFGDYMREGIFAALDAVEAATGERKATTIGYCVGGTLLAVALAHMAATGDDRVESATFLTTQVDFKHAGDLKVFVDEEQLTALEEGMQQRGYLEGSRMANAFNMLRPNDLIWPYMINNYLKGRAPMPFDLLYWNSDSTRMPAANHAFYMRNCYLENKLTKGEMVLDNVRLDLKKVTDPDLQSRRQGGPHRPCPLGLRRLEGLRRQGRLRHGRLRPHRRRRQPDVEAEIPVLDRRPAEGEVRGLGREGRGASRLVVAVLVRLGREAEPGARPGPRARRRQARPHLRRPGGIREGEGLRRLVIPGPREERNPEPINTSGAEAHNRFRGMTALETEKAGVSAGPFSSGFDAPLSF